MKFLSLFLLALGPLFGQGEIITNPVIGKVYSYRVGTSVSSPTLTVSEFLTFQITRAENGDKTFTFQLTACAYWHELNYVGPTPGTAKLTLQFKENCPDTPIEKSVVENFGPVLAQIGLFYDSYGDVAHHLVYGKVSAVGKREKTVVAPTAPANPYLIMLDGFGYDMLKFDLKTFGILSRVTLPPQASVYALRPTAAGVANEVWAVHGGTINEISISDLGTQKVLGTVPTPSLDPNNTLATGIVFTNDGATALVSVSYFTPDTSGNKGALLVFDVASRALTSTLPLKMAPAAFVMAPDGLTAYLLDDLGKIAYYDVLSGTADLTVSTFTPGKAGGYGSGPVFIHPDGTRLFWNENQFLNVFDLTTRHVTGRFDSGMPFTSAVSMQLSQDGSQAYMSNGAGAVVVLDTRYGQIMATYQADGASQVFGGPPGN